MLEKLQEDLKIAMKASDKISMLTIRMLIAEGKRDQINNNKELVASDWIALLKRGVKSREESLEHFRKNNRDDLVAKEEAEIEVLKKYLPQQITGEALEKLIDEAIATMNVSSKKEIGVVMKAVMGKHGSQVNGKEVQKIVSERLN